MVIADNISCIMAEGSEFAIVRRTRGDWTLGKIRNSYECSLPGISPTFLVDEGRMQQWYIVKNKRMFVCFGNDQGKQIFFQETRRVAADQMKLLQRDFALATRQGSPEVTLRNDIAQDIFKRVFPKDKKTTGV